MHLRFSLPRNPLDFKPDWKSMSRKDKAKYIWDYYKLWIGLIILIIYVICYFTWRYVRRTYPVLYTEAVNILIDDALVEDLTTRYMQDGAYGKRDRVYLSHTTYITEDPGSVLSTVSQASQMRIMAETSAKTLDIVFLDQEAFDILSRDGYLIDLHEFLDGNTQFSPKISEKVNAAMVENQWLIRDAQEEAATETQTDAAYGELGLTGKTVTGDYGIDLSGTDFFGPDRYEIPVYLGVIVNAPHPEEAVSYISYLFGERTDAQGADL